MSMVKNTTVMHKYRIMVFTNGMVFFLLLNLFYFTSLIQMSNTLKCILSRSTSCHFKSMLMVVMNVWPVGVDMLYLIVVMLMGMRLFVFSRMRVKMMSVIMGMDM